MYLEKDGAKGRLLEAEGLKGLRMSTAGGKGDSPEAQDRTTDEAQAGGRSTGRGIAFTWQGTVSRRKQSSDRGHGYTGRQCEGT